MVRQRSLKGPTRIFERSLPFDFAQGRDFGCGLPLRSRPQNASSSSPAGPTRILSIHRDDGSHWRWNSPWRPTFLRTVMVPSWDEIGKLGAIVVLRTVRNYFLEREIEKEQKKAEYVLESAA